MPTRIERLEASLKKEKERLDDKKLKDIHLHIHSARVILGAHLFQPHRREIASQLSGLIDDVLQCIYRAEPRIEDSPDDKAVT